jgi:hypothetical protein
MVEGWTVIRKDWECFPASSGVQVNMNETQNVKECFDSYAGKNMLETLVSE